MDSELLLKFTISQTTFRHCRVCFYAFLDNLCRNSCIQCEIYCGFQGEHISMAMPIHLNPAANTHKRLKNQADLINHILLIYPTPKSLFAPIIKVGTTRECVAGCARVPHAHSIRGTLQGENE